MIDKELQHKYIESVGRIFEDFWVPPTNDFISDFGTALLLKNGTISLYGGVGVGKTTLLAVSSYLLTGEDPAVATCDESQRPEDLLFEVDIKMKTDNGGKNSTTTYVFDPYPRPFLTKTFALANEFNRLGKAARNSFLSLFAERRIVVKGKELNRVDGIIFLDFNPYYGGIDWAQRDRIWCGIQVPKLELGSQLKLARIKYGNGHCADDLIAEAKSTKPYLTKEEMFKIWDDVKRVEFDSSYLSSVLLFVNIFSSCKYPIDRMHPSFNIDHDKCPFKRLCVMKELVHPVLTRSIDYIVKMMKAEAYFDDRNKVDVSRDILPALKRTILHRLEVSPEYISKYPTVEDWWVEEVEAKYDELQVKWKEAKRVYEEITKAVQNKDQVLASKTLMDFVSNADEIVSMNMVEILTPQVMAISENAYKKLQLRLKQFGWNLDYTRDDLEEASDRARELPTKMSESMLKEIAKLKLSLSGILQLSGDDWSDLVSRVMAIDPDMDVLKIGETRLGHIDISGSRGRFDWEYQSGSWIVNYDVNDISTARVFRGE